MEILVNGKQKIVSSDLTIGELLKELKIEPKAVVIELNFNILSKDQYSSIFLKDKDIIEIVHFVGGGFNA